MSNDKYKFCACQTKSGRIFCGYMIPIEDRGTFCQLMKCVEIRFIHESDDSYTPFPLFDFAVNGIDVSELSVSQVVNNATIFDIELIVLVSEFARATTFEGQPKNLIQ